MIFPFNNFPRFKYIVDVMNECLMTLQHEKQIGYECWSFKITEVIVLFNKYIFINLTCSKQTVEDHAYFFVRLSF